MMIQDLSKTYGPAFFESDITIGFAGKELTILIDTPNAQLQLTFNQNEMRQIKTMIEELLWENR